MWNWLCQCPMKPRPWILWNVCLMYLKKNTCFAKLQSLGTLSSPISLLPYFLDEMTHRHTESLGSSLWYPIMQRAKEATNKQVLCFPNTLYNRNALFNGLKRMNPQTSMRIIVCDVSQSSISLIYLVSKEPGHIFALIVVPNTQVLGRITFQLYLFSFSGAAVRHMLVIFIKL